MKPTIHFPRISPVDGAEKYGAISLRRSDQS